MDKSIIYYTDNLIEEPIKSGVLKYLLESDLPIFNISLKPLDIGMNIVLEMERGYVTMIMQILAGLATSTTSYVFFCEHDCLYPKSHFDFTPPKDDIFYYNENVWRWYFGSDKAISYDRLISLSGLCVNRRFALEHYKMRFEKIKEVGFDQFKSKEPALARKWGYEPGTKKKKRGGLTDDDFETWRSAQSIIDIRHKGTFSSPKVKLSDFKHPPKNWQEKPIEQLEGWNLKELFNL